ncbi:MAG: hypothetical protein AB8F95_02780 [Bacteroidia bacterium]
MELSKADIAKLYGDHLFVIPSENAEDEKTAPETEVVEATAEEPEVLIVAEPAVEAVSPQPEPKPGPEPSPEPVVESPAIEASPVPETLAGLQSGEPVQWKMRAGATLALVMSEAEFRNKLITNGLKQIVLDAGVNPKEIGFGVLAGEGEEWDFSDMPVPHAVVFKTIPVKKNPVKLPVGKVHISYPVSEIVLDPIKQQALLKLFTHINQE